LWEGRAFVMGRKKTKRSKKRSSGTTKRAACTLPRRAPLVAHRVVHRDEQIEESTYIYVRACVCVRVLNFALRHNMKNERGRKRALRRSFQPLVKYNCGEEVLERLRYKFALHCSNIYLCRFWIV